MDRLPSVRCVSHVPKPPEQKPVSASPEQKSPDEFFIWDEKMSSRERTKAQITHVWNTQVKARGKFFRDIWDKYGWTGLAFHSTMYLSCVFGCYQAFKYYPPAAQSVLDFLAQFEFLKERVDKISPDTVSLAAAILLAEVTDPLRIPISVWVTPRIVRFRNARKQAPAAGDTVDGTVKPEKVLKTKTADSRK